MARAQGLAIGLVGKIPVGGVAALAGGKPKIFAAAFEDVVHEALHSILRGRTTSSPLAQNTARRLTLRSQLSCALRSEPLAQRHLVELADGRLRQCLDERETLGQPPARDLRRR